MPVRGNTFKIFVGNLSDRATGQDIRELFEAHGTVVEADVVKNYGFVHMEKEDEGQASIEALNGHSLHGKVRVGRRRKVWDEGRKVCGMGEGRKEEGVWDEGRKEKGVWGG